MAAGSLTLAPICLSEIFHKVIFSDFIFAGMLPLFQKKHPLLLDKGVGFITLRKFYFFQYYEMPNHAIDNV